MIPDPADVAELLHRATTGDQAAVEALCDAVRDDLYGLSLRMLGHPADAEDATQEILILILTHLGGFEGRSSFRTWTWRIATNHLLRVKRGRREVFTFDALGEALDEQKKEPALPEPPEGSLAEKAVLLREVKFGCTSAMVLALDREHRLAFILCEILELSGQDAAAILEIEPAALRQRLSRARTRITDFMKDRCGWVDEKNPCRCSRQLPIALRGGHVDPQKLLFATHPERARPRENATERMEGEVDQLRRAVNVFRSHPDYAAPGVLREKLQRLISGGRFKMLNS